MNIRTGRTRAWKVAIALPVMMAALAACGSSGGGNSSPSGSANSPSASASSSGISTAVPSDYTGLDAKYVATLPDPTVKSGQPFKVGYLAISTAQPILVAMQNAAQKEVEALGGTMIVLDAQFDPQKQVSQANELLAQGVDAIICGPVFAQALAPTIKEAADKGIPFVTVAGSTGPEDTVPGVTSAVTQGFDYIAFRTVSAVAEKQPGASFATMGLGIPVAVVKYLTERQAYWAQQLGLTFKGNVDSQTDAPAGYSAAASTILTKWPDVGAISTYNDQAAIAISTTVSTQNATAKVVSANAGQALSGDAIKAGRLELVYRTPWETIGSQAAIAAYSALTKQGTVPAYLVVPSYIVDSSNVDQATWVD